jgi:CheY-like chemotaxis protein
MLAIAPCCRRQCGATVTPVANVLMIDDDVDGCEVVARYLGRMGHAVRCAQNGRSALSALAERVPDAILLDLLMPGMDGLALLEVVRSYLRWVSVPVAILTAYPEDPRLSRLAVHGVTRVFTKGKANLDELLAWVNEQAARPRPGGSNGAGISDVKTPTA